jgi:Domain of unknown function (DUF5668)
MSNVPSFCRSCGQALNEQEKAVASSQCGSCASPSMAQPSGFATATPPLADPGVSPGLAFLLGLIPGVGAIYNAQYAKGLVHVFIFGLLMTIASEGVGEPPPLVIMMVLGFICYMPFEAYHTAQKRQRGLPVDEFSSILPLKGRGNGAATAPLVLIGLGVVFLLHNFDILRMSQVRRLWPIALIGLGLHMLRERMRARPEPAPPPPPPLYRPYDEEGATKQPQGASHE